MTRECRRRSTQARGATVGDHRWPCGHSAVRAPALSAARERGCVCAGATCTCKNATSGELRAVGVGQKAEGEWRAQ
eukprot:8901204-Alexandrium_andersonii.AAC.1